MPVLETINSKQIQNQLDELRRKSKGASIYNPRSGKSTPNPYAKQIKDLEGKLSRAGDFNSQRGMVEAMIGERPEFQGVDSIDEFNKIRDMAFGTDSNPYYDLQRDKARQDTRFAIDDLSASNLGQMQNAYSQLAQSGGLSGGSRERIAADSAIAGMKGRQGLRASEMGNLSNIGIAEEGTRADQQAQVTNQLATNLQNQNAYSMDSWKENNQMRMAQLKAEEERKIAEANKPSCFKADTPIMMATNGAIKSARNIQVGDKLLGGGLVYSVKQALANPNEWYMYNGNMLQARHAVYENGAWIRVENAKDAVKTECADRLSFNFATENHIVVCGNMTTVSDMDETPLSDSVSDEESLRYKNEKLNGTLQAVS